MMSEPGFDTDADNNELADYTASSANAPIITAAPTTWSTASAAAEGDSGSSGTDSWSQDGWGTEEASDTTEPVETPEAQPGTSMTVSGSDSSSTAASVPAAQPSDSNEQQLDESSFG